MNAMMAPNERVLLARDPECSQAYTGASNEETVTAAYIAVGAYTETERDAELRGSRLPGYLMLEQYFAWCRAMWDTVEALPNGYDVETEDHEVLSLESPGYRASAAIGHWLASLCPVIEGYEELKLVDAQIDALLAEGVDRGYRLRLFRFRNGVFHYQRRSDDTKFTEFMDTEGEARLWAVHLERAFLRYFTENAANGYEAISEWLRR